jgi:RNA recognition motif-containing protein
MQKNKLFVGGLPYSMTDDEFKELFAPFGDVQSADIIFDRATNRSKGFGFVTFATDEEAQAAVDKLNNSEVGGRKIVVNVARPREERPPRDNNRW